MTVPLYIKLSAAQLKKLENRQPFQVSAAKLKGAFEDAESFDEAEIVVSEETAARVRAHLAANKGFRFGGDNVIEGGSLKKIFKAIKKHSGSIANVAKHFIPKQAVKGALTGALGAASTFVTGNPAAGVALANKVGNRYVDVAYDHDYTKPIGTLKDELSRETKNIVLEPVRGRGVRQIGGRRRAIADHRTAGETLMQQGDVQPGNGLVMLPEAAAGTGPRIVSERDIKPAVVRRGRFQKGSEEARAYMKALAAKRKPRGGSVVSYGGSVISYNGR